MSSRLVFKDHLSPLPVCDSCFSRKVRCDRGNPCGRCQDSNTACSRLRVIKRTRKIAQLAVMEDRDRIQPESPKATTTSQYPQSLSPCMHDGSASISNSSSGLVYQKSRGLSLDYDKPLSLHDAYVTIQYQINHPEWPSINGHQILEMGLRLASQLSEAFGDPVHLGLDSTVSEEQIKTPTVELLAWMLKDIKDTTLGPFVRDYFRHISEATLRQMGLNLLHRIGSPHELLISTVCVNSVAAKFLTAVINTGIDSKLVREMTHSLEQFQATAKVALRSISLLTSPSLELLQTLLFGIFLHQGSGDMNVCWELTNAACKVCIGLGLDAIMKAGGAVSEDQYYCVAWCYILDKNFAFKMGRSEPLLDIEIEHFTSDLARYQTSVFFQINLDLAGVQAAVVPYLREYSPTLIGGLSSSHGIGKVWFVNMQRIHEKIEHISGTYPAWDGVDDKSEISALRFAYHSIMTSIFQITVVSGTQSVEIRNQRLLEAHQCISSLASICISAERQQAVALLHWTLLAYPVTAYIVLFCNVVTKSDADDLKLMTTVVDCLARIETTSHPIIRARTIFRHFLSLAGKVFDYDTNAQIVTRDHQVHPAQTQPDTLQYWVPDNLCLSSTADPVPTFSPFLLDELEYPSGILPVFSENEMFTPFSDDLPGFGNEPSI